MSLGPVMLDLDGPNLLPDEVELLKHPAVGGVILFSRNYADDPARLANLCNEIHAARKTKLLIAVDHEGGRVQRFRVGFTEVPPMAAIGEVWAEDPKRARSLAEQAGWLLASELRSYGVDFTFAPVADLGKSISSVIGDRAFHRDPHVVSALTQACVRGLHAAGMPAVAKHFPGHGSVAADSHLDLPVDERDGQTIEQEDLIPFRALADSVEAVMPAHVLYPKVDATHPAGFSKHWLQGVLRQQLAFTGVIISDDLSMVGAARLGEYPARADAALAAGCDLLLVCNHREGAEAVLDHLVDYRSAASEARLMRLHGRGGLSPEALRATLAWQQAVAALAQVAPEETRELEV
jgi:beta-N-acetylhexosaminidase